MAKFYRTNENIRNQQLLVIDPEGNKLGVLSKEDALSKAREFELDLIEIAPNATPPVARILDFKKFKYEENKKEQAAKKNAKNVELKEIWLTPRIAEHDLNTRLARVEEFVSEDNRVMFRVKFKGREMGHTNLGFELLRKVFEKLGDKIQVEREPKLEGRSITAVVGRNRGGKKEETQKVEEVGESKIEEQVAQ